MGVTNLDRINSSVSSAKVCATLPTAPADYFGFTAAQEAGNVEWEGGELAYDSTNALLCVQTATSGTTASWVCLADTFASTTSTSTSSSTSTTTSTSSSSSTTTSTSTSTSSSTSTSTSTSSTTTSS